MMTIAVPALTLNSDAPAAAAVELGLFQRHGPDVSLQLTFPVEKAYQALRDGKTDVVAGSGLSAVLSCSVSLPMQRRGEAPSRLMLNTTANGDQRLMAIAASVEAAHCAVI